MRLGLLLVVAAIPFLEIALLIEVGRHIGFWPTVLLVLLSAAFGTFVIYEQGFQVLGRAAAAMSKGKAPLSHAIDGVFILLAGVLLIVPGFLSDVVGLALLLPSVRHTVAVLSIRRLVKSGKVRAFFFGEKVDAGGPAPDSGSRQAKGGPRAPWGQPTPPRGHGPIIEGEFERIDEKTVDHGRRNDRP